jgi:arsenite transporter
MSDVVSGPSPGGVDPDAPVMARLSFLDRFLPAWIIAAMAAGVGLGRAIPNLNTHLNAIQVTSGTSLPIFVGLLVMTYPVLAKVRYGQFGSVAGDAKMLASSLVLNWVVGPALMFTVAWVFLPHQPAYRTGLIIVGLARCIAMVLIWNDLCGGDREAAALLVAINSLFQIVAFALLGYFYLKLLPGWLGLSTVGVHLSMWKIAKTVLLFLGIPLVAGLLTRTLGERARGREWYETTMLPRLGPFALYGLLYTIVILFALQGHTITTKPGAVALIALPLLTYFAILWFGAFAWGRAIGLPYQRTATLAFTAAGNNFELAIAVAIGVFGVTSGEALAGVVAHRGSRPRRPGPRGPPGPPAIHPHLESRRLSGRTRLKGHPWQTSPSCCSCASITPGAVSPLGSSSTITLRAGSMSAPPAPSRPTG